MANDPIVDLKLNLDISGVNDALYNMIGTFKGTDKQFAAIAASIDKNAKMLEASIKRFGPASKEAENASKSLQKSLTGLVAYGINPTSDAFKKLESSLPQISKTMDNTANSVKKSNQQWTSLALVVQDLPYGFRGIQNNLPALFGSLATGSGAAYFAFSALVAIITAVDSGIIKFGNSVKLTSNYSKEAASTFASETIKLESLYSVSTNVNASMNERLQAAKTLKSEYPGLLNLYSEEEIILGQAEASYTKLIDTIWKYAQAKAAEKTLEELAIKRNDLLIKKNKTLAAQKEREIYAYTEVKSLTLDEMTFTQRLAKTFNDLPKGPLAMVNAFGAMSKSSDVLIGIEKDLKAINDEAFIYTNIINDNINAESKLSDAKLDPSKQIKKNAKDSQRLLDEEQRKKEANWAREQRVRMEIISFETKLQNDLQRLEDEKLKKQERVDSITESNAQSITNALRNIKQGFLKDDIDAIDKNTKQELRLNKNSRRASIDTLKKERQELLALRDKDIFEGVDTTSIDKKLVDNANALEAYTNTWTSTSDQINNAIDSMIEGGISTFAENIGKALAGGDVNLFDGILGILAEGLSTIGKALIAYGVAMDAFKKAFTNPYAAIAAGAALVVIGSFIATKVGQMAAGGASDKGGATPFANGGIVSGPTLGLMGEYPGAKSNPEVIAPLDKLKDMIGGGNGGGSFVLRGTDLVLAMNRSETSLNLRR